jgi:hypothetical protein
MPGPAGPGPDSAGLGHGRAHGIRAEPESRPDSDTVGGPGVRVRGAGGGYCDTGSLSLSRLRVSGGRHGGLPGSAALRLSSESEFESASGCQ